METTNNLEKGENLGYRPIVTLPGSIQDITTSWLPKRICKLTDNANCTALLHVVGNLGTAYPPEHPWSQLIICCSKKPTHLTFTDRAVDDCPCISANVPNIGISDKIYTMEIER